MIAALHQPNFLPWLGFFHKMAMADVLVLLDGVQLTKEWCARNRIKTPQGVQWFVMPYCHDKNQLADYRYCNTRTMYGKRWLKKVWGPIHQNYARASYFKDYAQSLELIFGAAGDRWLVDVNAALITWAANHLGITTRVVRQTVLGVTASRWDLPVAACRAVGCDVYLSGQGAKSYNRPDLFDAGGIELRYQEFEHPVYPQLWGDFKPYMAIIDLLFNCGPDARRILLNDVA